jgi:hypothetical protein
LAIAKIGAVVASTWLMRKVVGFEVNNLCIGTKIALVGTLLYSNND